MNTSTSLFAKALATENIFVSFDATAKSAMFDVESRTLTIPDWKISDTLRDMVVAHEVAHALFTPKEQLLSAMESAISKKLNTDGYKACINVIEDSRIERLIKEKFPGCRRDFYTGYKEVIDTDMFDLKKIDPNDFTIVDKINLHFKFGLFGLMHFDFTPGEQQVIDRVANAKTFEEVVEIANDLYAMAAEEEKQRGKGNGMFTGNSSASADLTEAMSDIECDGDPDAATSNERKFKDFPHLSYPLPRCNSAAAIIPTNVLLDECRFTDINNEKAASKTASGKQELTDFLTHSDKTLEEYRQETSSTVRELVAQFERRKAAEQYRKERYKPSGVINADRLHQYKTHDDIFLRNLVRFDGKKHSMVMLIDWSGSMGDCLDGLMRQVLLLTWFCRKAKIPYEVFFYTERGMCMSPEHRSTSGNDHYTEYAKRHEAMYGFKPEVKDRNQNSFELADVALRQVFSSTQSDEVAREMEKHLWRFRTRFDERSRFTYNCYSSAPIMDLHGTPSCEALMAIHDFIPKYREASGAQIVDFIFITDGEPTGLARSGNKAYIPVKSVRVQHMPTGRVCSVPGDLRYGDPICLQEKIQYFLVDEIRRQGVVTVGFSIGRMSGLDTSNVRKFLAPRYTGKTLKDAQEFDKVVDKIIKDGNVFYKRENFIVTDPSRTPGFDEYYLVRPVRPVGNEADSSANSTNSTLTKIRNQFIKSLHLRKNSKVFLSRFTDLIAGRKVPKFIGIK